MPYPYYQPYSNYNQMYLQQNVPQQQSVPQIQNGGFVFVKDIQEAMNYPVAPGNSVTFKIEGQPYICSKTLGFSQLDQPIFEKYRLVKEDNSNNSSESPNEKPKTQNEPPNPPIEYLTLEDASKITDELNNLREEVDFLKEYIETNEVKEVKEVKEVIEE